MAYDKNEILKESLELIKNENIFFIDELVTLLPCAMSTFYELFPASSEEMEEIKREIRKNKVKVKLGLKKKWHDSDNPVTQMALFKLVCTNKEREKLSMKYSKNETTVKMPETPIFGDNPLDDIE